MNKTFTFNTNRFNHKVPIFTERPGTDIINYGLDNIYPDYLLKMYRRSAKHNAIINGKVNYILGKGWEETPENKAFLDSPTFPNKVDSLFDLTQKLTLDLEIYNGFYLIITWNRGGQIASMEHVDFHKCRVSADEKKIYVADWTNEFGEPLFPNKSTWSEYPAFDPNSKVGKQIFYFRQYTPGVKCYPLPEYLGGLAYIELDVEIANWHNNAIKNNFNATWFINFPNGVPSEEESDDIERMIKKKFSGSDQAGSFLVNFSDSKDTEPTLTALQAPDWDNQFNTLNKTVQEEIFVAHRVTSPMLFGVKTEGQLGGAQERAESYEIFKKTYIEGRVQIIERMINYLASFNGVQGLKLVPTESINLQLGEATLMQILTRDELREIAGYQPQEAAQSASAVSEAINALSPLVANKVLESMSPNEIRGLAALPAKAEGSALPEEAQTGLPVDPSQPQSMTNGVLRSLSGREFQGMMRIVRQFNQGKLNKEQASLMMKQAYGLTDDDVMTMLGVDSDPLTEFSAAPELEAVAMAFGASADDYDVIASKPLRFAGDTSLLAEFEEVTPANKAIDDKVLNWVKRNKRVEADEISKAIRVPLEKVSERIEYLLAKERIAIRNRIAEVADDLPKVNFEIRYKYDLRPGTDGPKVLPTSRKFCETLIKLNKLYTREDIDKMSEIMGFSVWDRRGGWYTLPGTDLARPSCRHIWQQQLVRKKGDRIQRIEP